MLCAQGCLQHMDRFWDCTVHSSHKALVCILMFLRKGDERWVWWSVLICKILHCLYAPIQWSYLDGLGVGMPPGEILGLNVGSDIPDPWRTGFLGRNTIFVCLVCSVIFLWASFPKPVEAGAAALPGLCATFNARGTARKLSEHGYKMWMERIKDGLLSWKMKSSFQYLRFVFITTG